MIKKYPPISNKFQHFLHGADYNPEQWLSTQEIWDEDMRLMKLASCNVMSVGIFSWATFEPEENKYDFSWLDKIMDRLAENGCYAILATPSGAKPAWMSQKYQEILRVEASRVRDLSGKRHSHCYTSPIYREKTEKINRLLAERYKSHPALIAWHISNEYGGQCHCELCQEQFRLWLQKKYQNDLSLLNEQWWTGFWSHTFTDWSQIESLAPQGDSSIHGLAIDWKRFVTDRTIDFYKNEIQPLREITPYIPITTNFMQTYEGLNYWEFAKHVDFVSWDSYPKWRGLESDAYTAAETAFSHDIFRSLKGGQPFMLMESTPSLVNWQAVSGLKRPSQHLLSSLQAVAHGSDSVQYFQWRKGRGGSEKFHGAVVDHCGHENTRVFKDVAELGTLLKNLNPIIGTTVESEVALIFDWENRWALKELQGLRNDIKDYREVCIQHYEAFWKQGISVDVVNMDVDFSKYKLVVAPMLYMLKLGVGEKLDAFVKAGGHFVATYWTGIVNENDLCFIGGFPGPLRQVLGIWSEEIDTLPDNVTNTVRVSSDYTGILKPEYQARLYCDLFHTETAQVVANYSTDFYAGQPALSVNSYGDGSAYYIGFRSNSDFLTDFYKGLTQEISLKKALPIDLPAGVSVQTRTDGKHKYLFIMNFSPDTKSLSLENDTYLDFLSQTKIEGNLQLNPFGIKLLQTTY